MAHYYFFAEVYCGRSIQAQGDLFAYTGAEIRIPAAHSFSPGGDQTEFRLTPGPGPSSIVRPRVPVQADNPAAAG